MDLDAEFAELAEEAAEWAAFIEAACLEAMRYTLAWDPNGLKRA